jgi:transmembrane sensor
MSDDAIGSHRPGTPEGALLDRYLAGECTVEEAARMRRWAGVSASGTSYADEVREACRTVVPGTVDVEGIAQKVLDAARLSGEVREGLNARAKGIVARREQSLGRWVSREGKRTLPSMVSPKGRHGIGISRWTVSTRTLLASAAAAIVVLGAVLIGRSPKTALHHQSHSYTTTTGQRATVTLPDGSRVLLAPHSTLMAAETFGETRLVSLIGEAQFDVQAQSAAPFIVQTGAVTTTVLGTTFDVRRYPDDATVRVVVTRGKVATRNRHTSVTLTEGTVAQLTDSTATTTVTDPTIYTDWTHGRLAFTDAPVSVMLAALERWYGYRFQLADSSLIARHVTAEFNVDAPAETMQLLQRLLRVTMTFKGSVVILYPERRTGGEPARVRPRNAMEQFPVTTERGR